MKKLGLDFDGVICKRDGIPRQKCFLDCPPMDNAVEAIKELGKKYELYVLTNREDLDLVREWLKVNKFPKMLVTNSKQLDTQAYIDDRALRFTNWLDTTKYFS
jgi:5'(3')-deoxyribonucleotidase